MYIVDNIYFFWNCDILYDICMLEFKGWIEKNFDVVEVF